MRGGGGGGGGGGGWKGGGAAAGVQQKTRTPHRDVGKKSEAFKVTKRVHTAIHCITVLILTFIFFFFMYFLDFVVYSQVAKTSILLLDASCLHAKPVALREALHVDSATDRHGTEDLVKTRLKKRGNAKFPQV